MNTREPNLIVCYWEFYWDTMTQYNNCEDAWYQVRFNEKINSIEFMTVPKRGAGNWTGYVTGYMENNSIVNSYNEYMIETTLLGGNE